MQYRRFLLTLLLTVLSYKLMVTAFSLINKPSDIALYEGATLLAVTAICFITLVRLLWKRSTR
jgi:hypothetical protein